MTSTAIPGDSLPGDTVPGGEGDVMGTVIVINGSVSGPLEFVGKAGQ